jgi:hypothetical protein
MEKPQAVLLSFQTKFENETPRINENNTHGISSYTIEYRRLYYKQRKDDLLEYQNEYNTNRKKFNCDICNTETFNKKKHLESKRHKSKNSKNFSTENDLPSKLN